VKPPLEATPVGEHAFVWHRFAPEVKVDLWSTAVRQADAWWVIDPVGAPEEIIFPKCWPRCPPQAVLLTSENHLRDAVVWHAILGCNISAPPEMQTGYGDVPGIIFELPPNAPEQVPLPGGALGERAFWFETCALLVVGDAIINLPELPLSLLPDKYCEDPALLPRSLQHLDRLKPLAVTFAHGPPLVGGAACARLREVRLG